MNTYVDWDDNGRVLGTLLYTPPVYLIYQC